MKPNVGDFDYFEIFCRNTIWYWVISIFVSLIGGCP